MEPFSFDSRHTSVDFEYKEFGSGLIQESKSHFTLTHWCLPNCSLAYWSLLWLFQSTHIRFGCLSGSGIFFNASCSHINSFSFSKFISLLLVFSRYFNNAGTASSTFEKQTWYLSFKSKLFQSTFKVKNGQKTRTSTTIKNKICRYVSEKYIVFIKNCCSFGRGEKNRKNTWFLSNLLSLTTAILKHVFYVVQVLHVPTNIRNR